MFFLTNIVYDFKTCFDQGIDPAYSLLAVNLANML